MRLRLLLFLVFTMVGVFWGGVCGATDGSLGEWRELQFSVPSLLEPRDVKTPPIFRYTRSPVMFQARAKTYGSVVRDFLDGRELEEPERVFLEVVNAVSRGNLEGFIQYSKDEGEARRVFDLLVRGWAGMHDQILHYQISLGMLRVFIVSLPEGRVDTVTIRQMGNGFRYSPWEIRHVLVGVVRSFSEAIARGIDGMAPTEGGNGFSWVEMPWGDSGGAASTVTIGVNGEPMDWPVFSAAENGAVPPWASDAIHTYRLAMSALLDGRHEEYLGYLGVWSRHNMTQWLERIPEGERAGAARRLVPNDLRIRFAMRGEGLIILYLEDPRGSGVSKFSHVTLEEGAEGTWKIVNVMYEGKLDSLIDWPRFQKILSAAN